jgi:cytochrome c biogenesis protein CcmG, thiol:disulfide interchange protein DsbE
VVLALPVRVNAEYPRHVRVVIVLVVLLAGTAHAQVLAVGDKLAELDVAVDRNGKPVKLASFRGRWVLITIGAAWCPPCQKELPLWDQIAREHAGRITFIALDIDDDIADGIAYHKRLKLAHMVPIYLPQATTAVAGKYGADKMPSTFIADPTGRVRHVHAGFDARDPTGEARKLRAALAALLPAKPPPAKPPPAKPEPTPKPDARASVPAIVIPRFAESTLWSSAWKPLLRF